MTILTIEEVFHSIIFNEVQLCKGLERDGSLAQSLDALFRNTKNWGPIVIDIALANSSVPKTQKTIIRIISKKILTELCKNSVGLQTVREGRLLWQKITGDA